MRDLTDEPIDVVAAARSRVASGGWAEEHLRLVSPDVTTEQRRLLTA